MARHGADIVSFAVRLTLVLFCALFSLSVLAEEPGKPADIAPGQTQSADANAPTAARDRDAGPEKTQAPQAAGISTAKSEPEPEPGCDDN